MEVPRLVVVGILSLLLTVSWLSAETFLRVQVMDEEGNAVHKAEVTVGTFKAKRGKKDNTNRDGIAEFKKLKDGYYRIWARADGFKPGLFEFLRVGGEPEKQVRMELKSGFSGTELYFESPGALEKSRQLAREGVALMSAQKFAEAESKLLESVSMCPSDPATHQNLSMVYVSMSKWELAEDSLNDATELVQILSSVGGMESAEANTQRAELDQLRKVIPIRRLAEEADQALEKNDVEGAINILKELVELEPDNGDNYYYLANALARDGKTDEAMLAIDGALEKKPDEERYRRFKLSIAEIGQKQAGERAQEVVEEILKLQDAHAYEAVLERSRKATEELTDDFLGVLTIQMAKAYAGLSRTDEALNAYQKSLELAPDDVGFRREFTEYLIELERYDEAFSSLEVLSGMTSSAFDQSLLELAKELTKKGKQTQARVAFERVLEVNPDCAEAYYELGIEYYYGAQDNERAKAMLSKYLEIGKDPELLGNAKTLLKVIK